MVVRLHTIRLVISGVGGDATAGGFDRGGVVARSIEAECVQ